jgi:hypothetical protein
MTEQAKLLTEAQWRNVFAYNVDIALDYIRERGLIAEEPVDPLLVEARKIVYRANVSGGLSYSDFADRVARGKEDSDLEVQIALAALHRGIEIGEANRKELTREMVREADILASHERNYGDFLDRLTELLNAALQEQLK